MEGFHLRGPVIPAHPDPLLMVGEIIQIQFKSIPLGKNHLAEKIGKFRLSIRSQSHHFIFVPIKGKSQIHRHGAIKIADGMGEIGPVQFRPGGAPAKGCQGAGEVSHAIY